MASGWVGIAVKRSEHVALQELQYCDNGCRQADLMTMAMTMTMLAPLKLFTFLCVNAAIVVKPSFCRYENAFEHTKKHEPKRLLYVCVCVCLSKAIY